MKNETKHTPLPWWSPNSHAGEYQEIFGPHGPHHDDRLPIIGKADAEFIVRACNAHDALLAAARAGRALIIANFDLLHDLGALEVSERLHAAIEEATTSPS